MKETTKRKGTGTRALACLMAFVMAFYAIPASIFSHPVRAYAADGAAPLDIAEKVAGGLDGELARAPKAEEPSIFYKLFGWGEAPKILEESGHYLYVNHLYVAADEVEPGETMDSLWFDKKGAPGLGQTQTTAPLYNTDGDYFAAFTGDAGLSVGGEAMDWSFTQANLDGIRVEGCIHDPKTGISYIPKSYYYNEAGEEIFYGIQNQLMIPYDIKGDPAASVHVEIQNNNGAITAPAKDQTVELTAFDTVKVQIATPETASKIGLGNIRVNVDDAEYGGPGVLVDGENATYDSSTGELTLALPAISTAKVKVTVDDAKAIEKVLQVEKAHAASAADLKTMPYWTFTNLDMGNIYTGQRFSYELFYNSVEAVSQTDWGGSIVDARNKTAQYGYTWTNNIAASQTAIVDNQTYALSDWVLGGNTFTPDQILNTAYNNGTLTDVANSLSAWEAVGYTIDMPANGTWSHILRDQNGTEFDFTWRKNAGAPEMNTIAAWCGHNTEALGNSRGYIMNGGANATGQIHMRVLAKGDDYVVMGFLSPILNGQAGAAIYKFPVEAKGSIEVNKTSANPSITNGNACYSYKGAVFEVLNASGQLVTTITTGDDGKGRADNLPRGTYTVREKTAPAGFQKAGDQTATVTAGQTTSLTFADQPRNDPTAMRVWKSDAENQNHLPEGASSLEGAEFTFRYYDGYYDANNLPSMPKKTWVMKTNANGEASPRMGNAYKVSGDDFFYSNAGNIVFPLGTVTAVETKAPSGYFLDDGNGNAPKLFVSQIVASDSATGGGTVKPINYSGRENLSTLNTPISHDKVWRGNVELVKSDSATLDGKAQGAATLAGAEYQIISLNDKPVVSPETGKEVGKNGVVCTIVTDESGHASTTASEVNGWKIPDGTNPNMVDAKGKPMNFNGKALAIGSYLVKEAKASTGYNLNVDYEGTFTLAQDGELASLETTEDVIRGDIEFTKAQGERQNRLAGIPWTLTSKATGETHVLVTDENGMASTDAGYNLHSKNTNANDAALDEAGNVDETKLDSTAGVWFSGRTDGNGAPVDDALGALPYDTYTLTELRCSKNQDLDLVSFEVVISRHGRVIDLGTIDDNPAPYIGTTLTDDEETHTAPANSEWVLTDRVEYAYFDTGNYKFKGELHLIGADGTDEGVVATAEKDHVARSADGYVDMSFVIDTTGAEGKKYVAFEKCYNEAGELVASHEDPTDEYQTVHVPTARTTFTDAADGDHEAPSVGEITLTDTVRYTGLTPGKQYTADLVVHKKAEDGSDAGVLLDAEGNEVKASARFMPEQADGEVVVSVTFTPADGGGYEVVAFEEISRKGVTYAVHADITDEPQTVSIPEIRTTATDAASGIHALHLGDDLKLTDTVSYKGLTPGAEYKVAGTVHVRGISEDGEAATDEGPLKDAEGNEVTAEATFTPEKSSGIVQVSFEAKAAVAPGMSLVVFEQLTRVDNETLTAVHEDPSDDDQTVKSPKIGTTATANDTGAHFAGSVSEFTIKDDVKYENLPVGIEYTVRGELHKVDAEGKDAGAIEGATATAKFTPEKESGTVTLEFKVDPAKAAGTLVVFEELDYDHGETQTPVAEHKDPSDTGQQVDVASIGTQARDKVSGGHTATVESTATVIDKVSYSGLEPGGAYKLVGKLMDKASGKALVDDGKEVIAEKAFKADAKSGEAEMEFYVSNTVLDGTTVVVFEKLYDGKGELVATHEDINSADQSVSYEAPKLTPAGSPNSTGGSPLDKTGYWLAQYWWVLALIGCVALTIGACAYMSRKENVFNADEAKADEADKTSGAE